MRRGKSLTVLAVIAVAIGVFMNTAGKRPTSDDEEKNDLSAPVWSVLEQPDRYELLSIDPKQPTRNDDGTFTPSTRPADPTSQPSYIRGFLILGGVTIDDPAARGRVNDALRKSLRDWPHMYSLCMFQPRHAIRATRGDSTVEILICFHCGDLQTAMDGKRQGSAHVNMVTPPEFNAPLKAASVPLAPE